MKLDISIVRVTENYSTKTPRNLQVKKQSAKSMQHGLMKMQWNVGIVSRNFFLVFFAIRRLTFYHH